MPTTLKNNVVVDDARLDRLYEEDWNSLNYLVRNVRKTPTALPVAEHKPRSYSYRCPVWLDQGVEGACVSTGCGHELAASPAVVRGVTFPWCRENIYHPAQHEDPWVGCALGPRCPIEPSPEAYEGTSVLAGVKQLQRLGFVSEYTWALDLKEAVLGLGHHGPAIIGVNWYTGMFDTDSNGFIHPAGRIEGGHCLLVVGVKIAYKKATWSGWLRRQWEDVDLDKSYITLHNSWGKGWGVEGRAKMTLRDLGKLIEEQGEVCFVERTTKRQVDV